MKITFSKNSWEEYVSWQEDEKRILKKINELIKDIERHPLDGMGKPEPLRFDLAGFWSRRIKGEHRLVYKFTGNEILIFNCRYHYDEP